MSKALMFAILEYFSELKSSSSTPESFDVAIETLSEATGININNASEKQELSVRHLFSLEQIFAAGINALHNQQKPAQNNPVAPVASNSSNDATKDNTPSLTNFVSLLKDKGFFKDLTEGSNDYNLRLNQATQKYYERFPHMKNDNNNNNANNTVNSSNDNSSSNVTSSAPVAPSAADLALAEKYKLEGNTHLQSGDFNKAIESYTSAISLNKSSAIYYSNRAAAYINLKKFELALNDCKAAINVDPAYAKSYYRLGQSYIALQNDAQAEEAFLKAKTLMASDPNMIRSINEQLEMIKKRKNAGADPMGGMDFSQILSNPMFAQLASQLGGAGGGGAGANGGLDFNALLSNPAIMQMASQMMGGGGMGGLGGNSNTPAAAPSNPAPSNPSNPALDPQIASLMNSPAVQALRNDPELAPVFADVEREGQSAIFKHMNNPRVMSKLSGLMSQFMGPK